MGKGRYQVKTPRKMQIAHQGFSRDKKKKGSSAAAPVKSKKVRFEKAPEKAEKAKPACKENNSGKEPLLRKDYCEENNCKKEGD